MQIHNHNSKTDAVLAHLLSGRSITQAEAQVEYSLFRLPVVVQTIRSLGYVVDCEMRTAANGTRYGRYSLR
jgi:hypothetical protein